MNSFFGGSPSFSTGVPLGATNLVMVCELSIIISDESAIKHTFEMKGAAGTLNCGLCRNCVTRGLEDHDSDDWLVSYTCSDFSKFVPHTNSSVIAIIQHLQDQKSVLSTAAFDRLEQSLGYNLIDDGLLLHPKLGHKVLQTVPWLHLVMSLILPVHFFMNDIDALFVDLQTVSTECEVMYD